MAMNVRFIVLLAVLQCGWPAGTLAQAPADPAAPVPAPAEAPVVESFEFAPRERILNVQASERYAAEELLWLGAGETQHLALYRPPYLDDLGRTAIIVTAPGQAADELPVFDSLRTLIPQARWASLLVQAPLLPRTQNYAAYDALGPEICRRLNAALKHLEQQAQKQIVIVGFGRVVDHIAACFSDKLPREVVGVVAIGPWLAELARLPVPILDIVPTRESAGVRAAAARRRAARERRSARREWTYRQREMVGADRRFVGFETELAETVKAWLGKIPPALE